MVAIKKISPERWRESQALRLEALKHDSIAFGSSFEEEVYMTEDEVKRRIENTLFALIDDRLVGCISVVFNNRLKTKHIADIYGVYVSQKYRNQGIGGQLMDAAMSLVKENTDICKIKLSVNPEQIYAVRLYEKQGFKIMGTAKKELFVDGKFYDEIMMEKFL